MQRLTLAFLMLVIGNITAFSQSAGKDGRLVFEIKDANTNEVLDNVTCRVYSRAGKFYAYAISDKDGNMTVSAHDGDTLEFGSVGYKTRKMSVADFRHDAANIIMMTPEAVELREVVVKIPPIRSANDTLIYNVGAFVKAGDRHLEDVLKKLPGIKVAENGSVTYQGKAINKFYIEGKDLLGSSYNQATRNMPIDAVSDVEVYENHQPVKMLQNKQFSDRAALNIKLKNGYKSRPFGEIEGGIGGKPTIWNNRIFLTQILGKSQLLVSGKMNNTGADLSDETQEHIDVADLDAYEPQMAEVLSGGSLANEVVSQDRYLRNKSYSLGLNSLTAISKDATLRANVLLYSDHSSNISNCEYIYGGAQPVDITENTHTKQQTLRVLPILKYELNASRAYVSDELRYSFGRTRYSNSVSANGSMLAENIYDKPSYLQNYYSSSFFVGRQILQVKSLTRYFNRRESLTDVDESESIYNADERYATRSFVTKNLVSMNMKLWRNELSLNGKVYYRNNLYGYKDEMRSENLNISFSPDYYIVFGRDNGIDFELPVEWRSASVISADGKRSNRNYISFSPELRFRYQFARDWRMVFKASVTTDDDMADFYSPHNLRAGYRSILVPDNGIYAEKAVRMSLRVNYRDLASMLFANVSVAYIDRKKENYINYDFTETFTTLTRVAGDNHQRSFFANASADKSFTGIGLTVKTEVEYDITKYLLSQSSELTVNRSNNVMARIGLTWQKLNWLRLAVNTTGRLNWERSDVYKSDVLSSLVTDASVFLFPMRKVDIKFRFNHYLNEIEPSRHKSCGFLNAEANYTLNKVWQLGIVVSNCLNSKEYSVTDYSGLNTSYTVLPLRGREVLARILFRL